MLCVGLDPDPARLPASFDRRHRSTYEFCKAIVDATADTVCAFKPQFAYFAAQRAEPELETALQLHPRHLSRRAADPRRQARRHRPDRPAVRARGVRSLRRRCRHGQPVPRHRLGRAVPGVRRTRRLRAVPHLESRWQRLPVTRRQGRAAVRPRRSSGGDGVERDRRMRARRRRDVPRRARHRAGDRRRHAGARAGRRRPGWRHRSDRRSGCDGRRLRHGDQLVAGHPVRIERCRLRRGSAPRGRRHPRQRIHAASSPADIATVSRSRRRPR